MKKKQVVLDTFLYPETITKQAIALEIRQELIENNIVYLKEWAEKKRYKYDIVREGAKHGVIKGYYKMRRAGKHGFIIYPFSADEIIRKIKMDYIAERIKEGKTIDEILNDENELKKIQMIIDEKMNEMRKNGAVINNDADEQKMNLEKVLNIVSVL